MNRDKTIREQMARRSAAWSEGPERRSHTPNVLSIDAPTNIPSGHHAGLNDSPTARQRRNTAHAPPPESPFATRGQLVPTSSSSITQAPMSGRLDGPLPKEARQIIYSSIQGGAGSEAAEQAEQYARRLLSTFRRVRVYKEELQAAQEEVQDYHGLTSQSGLVSNAIRGEVADLDARIQELVNERQMALMQLEQEESKQQRLIQKREEAQRRVDALRGTIDSIASESQRGQMLLRQLVPNLNIENFVQ